MCILYFLHISSNCLLYNDERLQINYILKDNSRFFEESTDEEKKLFITNENESDDRVRNVCL